MDLTGREVSRLLGLGRSSTSRVLAAGLAGPGYQRGRAVLYDRGAVAALAARRVLTDATPLPHACRDGVLIARVGPRRDLAEAPKELARGPWRLNVARHIVLSVVRRRGPAPLVVPLVVTVAGFVLGGAEVTGFRVDGTLTHFEVEEPGDWFATFRDARVPMGPGDPLRFWRCRWYVETAHARHAGLTTLEGQSWPTRARPRATAG